MNETIFLNRPDVEVGDLREHRVELSLAPFDLHGRSHEISDAVARVGVTRMTDGIHLDVSVRAEVRTTCDRTLEEVLLPVDFRDSEFLEGPFDEELSVREWTLDPKAYAERAIPNEVPMQVFAEGTEPVGRDAPERERDSRWKGLDDLFASGF